MENEVTNLEEAESRQVDHAQKAAVKAAVEAIVYVAEEPVTVQQMVDALGGGLSLAKAERKDQFLKDKFLAEDISETPADGETPEDTSLEQDVIESLHLLQQECRRDDRGLEIREIAGGYKMFSKAEHHETIRQFVKNLTPPLKLSMAALETLATIAYRQPVTVPEIQQIRGVNATGVLKTLLDRKLITTAGRKNVLGRPILYKTTREFLVKFGLNGIADLPTLEEFGELARAALGGDEVESPEASAVSGDDSPDGSRSFRHSSLSLVEAEESASVAEQAADDRAGVHSDAPSAGGQSNPGDSHGA